MTIIYVLTFKECSSNSDSMCGSNNFCNSGQCKYIHMTLFLDYKSLMITRFSIKLQKWINIIVFKYFQGYEKRWGQQCGGERFDENTYYDYESAFSTCNRNGGCRCIQDNDGRRLYLYSSTLEGEANSDWDALTKIGKF